MLDKVVYHSLCVPQATISLPYLYFTKNSETEQVDVAVTACIREVPVQISSKMQVILTKAFLGFTPSLRSSNSISRLFLPNRSQFTILQSSYDYVV